jgi:hypothetical protein
MDHMVAAAAEHRAELRDLLRERATEPVAVCRGVRHAEDVEAHHQYSVM